MKALKISLGAAALMMVAQTASAAGIIEYDRFTNYDTVMWQDLGGAWDGMADATINHNDFNGAATLPGGLPMDYSIHIDRTYLGDGNATTADRVKDGYYFRLDAGTMAGPTATADATLTIATGYDTGMTGIMFKLFEATSSGGFGAQLAEVGEGNFVVGGLDPSKTYILRVAGYLSADDPSTPGNESTNTGRYDVVLGLGSLAPIPVPPALILLMTAVGALFGFNRVRKTATA